MKNGWQFGAYSTSLRNEAENYRLIPTKSDSTDLNILMQSPKYGMNSGDVCDTDGCAFANKTWKRVRVCCKTVCTSAHIVGDLDRTRDANRLE